MSLVGIMADVCGHGAGGTENSAGKDAEDARVPDKRKVMEEEEEAEKTAAEDEPLLKKKCVMNMVPSKPEVDRTSDSSETDSKLIKVAAPIKMSLAAQKSKESGTIIKKSAAVAHAFNPDEDSDEEEMPPEAKMRMRNIGRDTPTAAGPNSYGKNRLGFCDRHRIFEREMKKKMEEVADKDG